MKNGGKNKSVVYNFVQCSSKVQGMIALLFELRRLYSDLSCQNGIYCLNFPFFYIILKMRLCF